MTFDLVKGQIIAPDGRVFKAGDEITIDGTKGEVLAGAAQMLSPVLRSLIRI